jgi:hypothetical protein
VTVPIGPAVNSFGTPDNPGWRVAPQPLPEEPQRSSLGGILLVLAVMFGWLLVVFGMDAIVARNDPNVEVPTEVNLGVFVTPADGWYSAAEEWDVGEHGLAFKKSGSYVAFWVESYGGSNAELMAAVLEELRPGFESFRSLPSRPITVAGDLAGLMVQFTGTTGWGQEENEVVVLSYRGISVVVLVEALSGELGWIQDDVDTMLETMTVPR